MNKVVVALAIVLALVIGGALGYASAGSQYSAQLAKDAAQLDRAKAAFPTQPTVQVVSGTIQSISGNTITLQSSPGINPFEDLPAVRTVTLTSGTKIVKNEQKDPGVLQQETVDFQKEIQKTAPSVGTSTVPTAPPPTPPNPFTETPINLSDLKAGDTISVEAAKDIKTASAFDAVKITLIVTPGLPVSPPPAAGVNLPNTGTPPAINGPMNIAPNGALY